MEKIIPTLKVFFLYNKHYHFFQVQVQFILGMFLRNPSMYVTHLSLHVQAGVAISMTFREFASVMMYVYIIEIVVLTMRRCVLKMTQ